MIIIAIIAHRSYGWNDWNGWYGWLLIRPSVEGFFNMDSGGHPSGD